MLIEVIEGAYSMDGDIAPVPDFVRVKKEYGCFLMVDEGLQSNEGWTVSADDEVLFQQRRLLDKQGEPVDAATKVEAGQYSLEAEAQDGGDVTPVVPE